MCEALDQSVLYPSHHTPRHTNFWFIEGLMEIVCPVQANRTRPASIQSVVPSRLTVVIEVLEDFVDISAVTGLVDDIF